MSYSCEEREYKSKRLAQEYSHCQPSKPAMSNDAPTDGFSLLDAKVDLISCSTVVAVLYTFSFSLYCLSTRLFYFQSRDKHGGKVGRRTSFMFALASIMIICATIDVIINNLHIQTMYIGSSGLPGNPDAALPKTYSQADVNADLVVTAVVSSLLLSLLVSLHLLWFRESHTGCSVVACLDCLEWNSFCHANQYSFSIPLSGSYW
jgi:hypothetical protein